MIYLILEVPIIVEKQIYEKVLQEKQTLDNALVCATDSETNALRFVYGGETKTKLEITSEHFFQALSLFLNYEMEMTSLCVPVFVVADVEGFYVSYLKESKNEQGESIVKRVWSECIPYVYSDNAYIYRIFLDDTIYAIHRRNHNVIETSFHEVKNQVELYELFEEGNLFVSEEAYQEKKRSAIITSLESTMTQILNTNNQIMEQYGIHTYFHVPTFFDTYEPTVSPSVIAVFQGWPISINGKMVYSNCAVSASFLKEKQKYIVEIPNSLEQPFAVFHQPSCKKIGMYGKVLNQTYYLEDAIKQYGAYACPICFSSLDGVAILP